MTDQRSFTPSSDMGRLRWLALSLFLSYLSVAMSLPVTAMHVHQQLGLGDTAGGLAVGIAFFSTILTRHLAGRRSDEYGGRNAMGRGLGIYIAAALVCLLSTLPWLAPAPAYLVLLIGRLLLGLGESLVTVGMISWGIGLVGPSRSGRVMSLMGMGMYGAFAAGGPLGLAIYHVAGFAGLMIVAALLPLLGLVMVRPLPGVAPSPGKREPFWHIMKRVWRTGAVVGLQGVGFAAIGAFISLYFQQNDWPWAGLGLTGFGVGFVLVRLGFGHLPDRLGGVRVAAVSLSVEALGQALLWQAGGPVMALAGAFLTGLGCSMVFPAMGVEALRRVPDHLRATAMGGIAACQDIAYGATGPVAGLFAGLLGYAVVFQIGFLAALLGLIMLWLSQRQPISPA